MTRYNEIPGYTAITYYFQYNHRGDVLSMTDQWGTVVAKYTYDPWGNILSVKDGNNVDVSANPTHRANINPIRYAGYRYDSETKLYYLLARYYDPATYRFLTKDPDGGDKDRPLSQNPYAYGEGDPVNNVDPEGEHALTAVYLTSISLAKIGFGYYLFFGGVTVLTPEVVGFIQIRLRFFKNGKLIATINKFGKMRSTFSAYFGTPVRGRGTYRVNVQVLTAIPSFYSTNISKKLK